MDVSSKYIESCKKLYGALMVITLIVAYFAYAAVDRRAYEDQLAFVDQILALRHVVLSDLDHARALRVVDLTDLSLIASMDQVDEESDALAEGAKRELRGADSTDDEDTYVSNPIERTFSKDVINEAIFLKSVPVRLGPGRCRLGLFTGDGTQKISVNLSNFMVEDVADEVGANEVYLANFGYRCGYRWARYRKSLSALLFPNLGEKGVIGVAGQFSDLMPRFHPRGEKFGSRFNEFRFSENWFSTIPVELKKYVYWHDTYLLVTITAIEAWILRLAKERTGKFFSVQEFDEAVSQVFMSVRAREAQVLGITLAAELVINLAPIAVLLIAFLLIRRTKTLVNRGVISDLPWVLTDTSDWVGRTFRWVYVFSPLAAMLFICMAFDQAQDLGSMIGFHLFAYFDNLLPKVAIFPAPGPINIWGFVMLGIFSVNIVLAILLVFRFRAISNLSKAPNA